VLLPSVRVTTIGSKAITGVNAARPAAGADAAAKKLIADARSNLGWHEGANNSNPYTKHVMGDPHQPWCAAYVSTMLEKQSIPGVSKQMFSASARGLAGQFQHAGRYFPSGSKPPQPGDVIFFGGRGSEHHTGIVEKVENGKVFTVEGNSSDKVSERIYSLHDPGIGGYGRVFGEGQVSSDVGVDTSRAGKGTAGHAPSGRATGRGSYGRALDNGIDPTAYFTSTPDTMLALIKALASGAPAGAESALAEMFPYLSTEDISALAQLLMENPELAKKVEANPEILQQLAANPDAVRGLVSAGKSAGWSPPASPISGGSWGR
jgi:hypothetical protein